MHHPPKKTQRRRIKRWIWPAALLVCLGLACAFVLLVPVIRRAFPGQSAQVAVQTVSQRVFAITEPEQLERVVICPEWGEGYTLHMQNGVLMLEEDGELLDLNDTYASELLAAVTQIVGQGVVAEDAAEVAGHLEAMQLDPPLASAHMYYTDGSEATLEIGAAVPNTTYAYCRWSGSPAVYMCDAGVVDALNLPRNLLLPVEQPVIYAELLNEIVIENAQGRCRLSLTDGAYGRMEEPYDYPLEATAAASLLSALNQFRLGTLEGDVTEENSAAYGFDHPLCTLELTSSAGVTSEVEENGQLVTRMRPAQALRFVIGREEGEYFYTCEYEGKCYLISRFLAQNIVHLRFDLLLTRHPLDVGELAIRQIEITTPGKTAVFNVQRVESVLPNNELELDADGNVVWQTTVTLNGEPCAAALLDEMVSRLDAVAVSSDAPADFIPSGEKRWSVSLETETGLVRTVEAWEKDLFSDVIAVDGTVLHSVHSEVIDVLAQGLTGSTGAHDHQ